MPRNEPQNYSFSPPVDASNSEIIAAVNSNSPKEVVHTLEETNSVLKKTHLGHELHLWGEEVEETE